MTGIISYGTITIDAESSGYTIGQFVDIPSIQADLVRVYNVGTSEVFVGFGSSDAQEATATIPAKSEEANAFPVPPKESVILHKGAGNDQVAVVTQGGKSPVRVTAVKAANSGGGVI